MSPYREPATPEAPPVKRAWFALPLVGALTCGALSITEAHAWAVAGFCAAVAVAVGLSLASLCALIWSMDGGRDLLHGSAALSVLGPLTTAAWCGVRWVAAGSVPYATTIALAAAALSLLLLTVHVHMRGSVK